MDFAPAHLGRGRLAAWLLFIAASVVALVALQHAGTWRGGAGEHDGTAPIAQMSPAQSERCLTAHGLHVTSAGVRSLHVTGPSRIDVTLRFYPTFEQAQDAALRWSRDPSAPRRVTRAGVRGGAMDTVAYRSRFVLDDQDVRVFSGCVGHQPA